MKIPKSVRILNTVIHPIHFEDVTNYIGESVKKGRRAVVFAMNIHILVELSKDMVFKKSHETADIIFCDGVPLIWISKFTRHVLPERVGGTDIVEKLLEKPYRIFLFGSTPKVLTKMKRKYSGICGTLSPAFKETWGRIETREMIRKINASKPDILLVALGPLKQERWIINNKEMIHAPVLMGVGSALNILSGITPRAPKTVQQAGFEWFWRVLYEPRRLGRRYVTDAITIIRLVIYHFYRNSFLS